MRELQKTGQNPSKILAKEDYIEPRCVLYEEPYGAEAAVRSVPQRRIIDKMNDSELKRMSRQLDRLEEVIAELREHLA